MSGVEGALRSPVRGELRAAGIVPTASKLYQPQPGIVRRTALVQRVRSARADVVMVTAPAGYGKSTFVAELTAGDPRPTAWVTVSASENDPASLLTYVALALDAIEPVDPHCVSALWTRSPTIGSAALQRFGAMFGARDRPFTLVLDDVHELVRREVLDTLPLLVAELPRGSSIVLSSRTSVALPLGRLRVARRVVEVALGDLAFDTGEAAALLTELCVDLPADDTARLVERTEGWPVGLYLAALAHGSRTSQLPDADAGSRSALGEDFGGDHRYLVDYLGEELLGGLDPDVATFLMEASSFERMSGGLCDEVLERSGSVQLLEAIHARNLLVIPLDDRREWYRFHHLMADFLQTELQRRDPERYAAVHRRASDWCEAHGDGDGAIAHALRSGDVERAVALVTISFGRVAAAGKYPAVERWLSLFPSDSLNAQPGLMVAAAHERFRDGQGGAAVQWLERAGAALPERYPADVVGPAVPVLLAAARAVIAPIPPAEMARDAQYAYEHAGGGEGHPLSCLARGAAAFMMGDEAQAVRWLREGAATTLDRPLVEASALAHLAVIDAERGRWTEATTAAHRARAILGESINIPTGNLVLAINVLVDTHAGQGDKVEADRQLCRQHLVDLLGTAPWINLQARIALARASLLQGDRVEATALIEEVESILLTTPGAVRVAEQLAELRRATVTRDRSQSHGPASLTTAELRVLQLLPTHLSVAEIADRLYVSRNTVKSQTIAIYRKLGTSSRGGAVEIAIAAGVLDGRTRRM